MSYDLYFRRPREAGPLASAEVLAYFAQRPHYTVDHEAKQAFYANERTGVYFTFEVSGGDEAAEDDGSVDAGVSFNLNYFRPHVFASEAEPEIAAFVERFGLSVDDPQNDGMGRGPYSRDGFLQGWNAGNRFAYQVVAKQDAEPPATLPAAEIERIWQWNRRGDALRAQYGEEVFVPRIMCGLLEGRVITFAVWGDYIPIALPRVDWVVLVRPKSRLFGLLPGKPETIPLRWEALAEWSAQADPVEDPTAGRYFLFRGHALMTKVKAMFLKQAAEPLPMSSLTIDAVLDADLLAEAVATPLKARDPEAP